MAEERRDKWALYLGVGLVGLGIWLFVQRTAGSWMAPVRAVWRTVQSFGWPLAVIILGVLLIVGFPRISATQMKGRRLYRSRRDKILGGVLAGVADYIGADPTWVRLAYVLFAIVVGFGPAFVIYIVANIIVPKEPEVPAEIVVEPVVVPAPPAAPPSAPAPGTTPPPAPPVPPIPGQEK